MSEPARQLPLPSSCPHPAIVSEIANGVEVASWCEACHMDGDAAWAEILERRAADAPWLKEGEDEGA